MNKYLYKISFIVSLSFLINGCTFKEVEVIKHTDKLLSCEKLSTQIADLMDINNDINEETGLKKLSLTAWIIWPPIGVYNQYNAYMARDKIDDRLDHLIELKYKYRCNITPKERYYMRYKGRLSDMLNQ